MRHIKSVSVQKASDSAGLIFFQIWLSVFTSILAGAFGIKGK